LAGVDKKSADTSIHEYGHNVMWNVYGHWWPDTHCPSPHYLSSIEDLACAWTEGWADFHPLVVNGNSVYTWASGASTNLETPTWGTSGWDRGPGVEGRVAGALWDIYDSSNDGADQFSYGFYGIDYILFHRQNSVFAGFWNDWLYTYGYTDLASRCIYQNSIDFRPGKIGVFYNGAWYRDYNGNGYWDSGDISGSFGFSGSQPVVGDWNADGKDEIGVFYNGAWYIDYNGNGYWDSGDISGSFGFSGSLPVAGDWNSDGRDNFGVFSGGTWYLDYNGNGNWDSGDLSRSFGFSGSLPATGYWN